MKVLRVAVLAAIGCLIGSGSYACDFDSLSSAVDDAAQAIKRVMNATDLSSAQYEAGRAQRRLSDAKDAANECDCSNASSDFGSARRQMRNAEYEGDPTAFSDYLDTAFRRFNSAVDALNNGDCG